MLTQEKFMSLKSYLSNMQYKVSCAQVPEKHRHAPQVYRDWLNREIRRTEFRLDNESIVVDKKVK